MNALDGEEIHDIEELNEGDEVITSKGDSMDKRPLRVREIREIDGSLSAIISGDWKESRGYELVNSELTGIAMPDVGVITVIRVSEADSDD